MRVLIACFGSHGDVHPFIAIGKELLKRGHEPILLTSGYFRNIAEREGLGFVDLIARESY